jgi:nicotinamide phosphoribosyltransferase
VSLPDPIADNLILDTDSYKASHWLQYPPDVTSMYSYFESRGGRYRDTVFFGLQYYLLEHLARPVTRAHVDEASTFFAKHGEPFNRPGWEHLVDRYGGRLPVRIRGCSARTRSMRCVRRRTSTSRERVPGRPGGYGPPR